MNASTTRFLRRAAAPVVLAILATTAGARLHAQAPAGNGSMEMRVLDAASEAPLSGVTVAIDALPPQETDRQGRCRFGGLPAGSYTVTLFKAGYFPGKVTDVVIEPGVSTPLVYPMRSRAQDDTVAGAVYEMEEFVITATALQNSDFTLRQMRFEANFAMDTLSVADLAKFAASDVADAIKRIPGINVQEGKFAVIRGLDERYTSTLLNNLAIPSPDPDRQSPQLDLFPSDVVGSLVVAKTFSPELPGNSAGGSINIVTNAAPEAREVTLSFGTGYNANARDRFLIARKGSAIGAVSEDNQREMDLGAGFATPFEIGSRGGYILADFSREIDYATVTGTDQKWKPRESRVQFIFPPFPARQQLVYGDLALGTLTSDEGLWDRTVSTREERITGFLSLGYNLDPAGHHNLGAVLFTTDNSEETLSLKENGRFSGIDYASIGNEEFVEAVRDTGVGTNFIWSLIVKEAPDPWLQGNPGTRFTSSSSYFRDRDFRVGQLFGKHRWDGDSPLKLEWGMNYAETSQDEQAQRFTYYYQPEGSLPDYPEFEDTYFAPDGQTFSGIFFFSRNAIEESMFAGRADGAYEFAFAGGPKLELKAGFHYEDAGRSVQAAFADRFRRQGNLLYASDPASLEQTVYATSNSFTPEESFSDTARTIRAMSLGTKWSLTDKLDLLAGVRVENIRIQTSYELTGQPDAQGVPRTFPSKFLMFEVVDSVSDGYGNLGAFFETYENSNAGLLNLDVPRDADGKVNLTAAQYRDLLNSSIDETFALPAFGLVYRPREGLRWILGYSDTVARPSFRELGYYVSADPGSEELVVGNPQLGTSRVNSYDLRMEYAYGGAMDLVAFSVFKKDIADPIEKITLYDRQLKQSFQTFFNNENPAELRGAEFEFRKGLGFLGPRFLEFFTLGGNFTCIDAAVARPAAELQRAEFFFLLPNPPASAGLTGEPVRLEMPVERPLFNQPEWIANADLTFEHPGWGTSVTLSVFSISEVLGSAGSSTVITSGAVIDVVPDRYIGSYRQWDLVVQQKWRGWSFKFSVKNLTDSERTTYYDPVLIDPRIKEKSFRVGRDYSLSATYSF